MPSIEPAWWVAQLVGGREQLATHCLGKLGYKVYSPKVRRRRALRGRMVDDQVSLFPGYCFIEVTSQWHQVRWAPGVFCLLFDGNRPAKLSNRIISELRGRERNGLIALPQAPRLQIGDPLRVRSGPFQGWAGLYQGQRSGDRVSVLLSMLGHVTLRAADVCLSP